MKWKKEKNPLCDPSKLNIIGRLGSHLRTFDPINFLLVLCNPSDAADK